MDNQDKFYITNVEQFPNSVYCFYDTINDTVIPRHKHAKSQLIYTEGGIVHIKTETRTYFLPARHYMWIPANVEHEIYSNNVNMMGRNYYFPKNFLNNEVEIEEGIYPLNDLLYQIILYTSSWNGNVSKADKSRYKICEAFMVLLQENRFKNIPLSLPKAKDERLRTVLLYMSENVMEDLKISEISRLFNFSERTLQRLFVKDLAMNFIQYYTVLRMLKAIELLLHEDITINEIALRIGYNSTSTFSNTFFKMIGKRPTEYMKKYV